MTKRNEMLRINDVDELGLLAKEESMLKLGFVDQWFGDESNWSNA